MFFSRRWPAICLAVCLSLVPICSALRFDVVGGTSKCVGEEIMSGVLAVGDYSVIAGGHSEKLSIKVTSPYGNILHQNDGAEHGQFGFTTKETGNYMACFWLTPTATSPGVTMTVQLDWKTGVQAKDWNQIAKKEKLEGLELGLRQLEEVVLQINTEMIEMREREEKMRNINESTNARVAWFSLLSLLACMGVALWQLWHLKTFFERKKLL